MKLLELIDLPVSEEVPSGLPAQECAEGDEYETLCKLVGYGNKWDPAAHPLARWLRRMEVPVYQMGDIEAYMERKRVENKWTRASLDRRPLRSADKEEWRATSVYAEPVPIEVLRLVGAVVKEFDKEIRCEVLSIEQDKDPFLLIEHKKSREWFVVAHWDEPGFSIRG